MKAVALQSTSYIPPAKKPKAAASPASVSACSIQTTSTIDQPVIQRKSLCACGGGCPACQTKSSDLKVSQRNDPAEIEADHIADRVMRMPEDKATPITTRESSASSIHRKCSACEGEEETIQRKPLPSSGGAASQSPVHVRDAISAGGRPLDAQTRSFFEPRFGYDLSHVRVHTGGMAADSALELNAHAYALGHDVVFGAGRFAPGTHEGRTLIAHELAHVVQQGNSRLVQRQKVKDLVDMVHSELERREALEFEITSSMTRSGRGLDVVGTAAEQEESLREHVTARIGVVDFARANKFSFTTGETSVNPDYWNDTGGVEHGMKEGVESKDAYDDLHKNPDKYELECKEAARLTMRGGSGFFETKDENVKPDDWIPGDWGYIKNTGTGKMVMGEIGENIIYLGNGLVYGLSNNKQIRTMQEWFDAVKSWNGAAEILNWRKRPGTKKIPA